MRGQAFSDERDQVRLADGPTETLGDHEGHDPLAEIRVRHADDRGLPHARVPEQRVLDLAGADPVATALDQVGATPGRRSGASRRRRSRPCRRSGTSRPRCRTRRWPPAGAGSPRTRSGRAPGARRCFAVVGTGSPSSSTSRVSTPASGRPTPPGRRSPSARPADGDQRLGHPVALDRRVPGQLVQPGEHRRRQRRVPETSSRAAASARAAEPVRRTPATTPSARRSTACRRPPRTPRASAGRCAPAGSVRSAPSRPSTSPCTWNSGSPCTSVSSGVHAQASASASRSAAIAAPVTDTPLGARWCRWCRGSARCRRGPPAAAAPTDRRDRSTSLDDHRGAPESGEQVRALGRCRNRAAAARSSRPRPARPPSRRQCPSVGRRIVPPRPSCPTRSAATAAAARRSASPEIAAPSTTIASARSNAPESRPFSTPRTLRPRRGRPREVPLRTRVRPGRVVRDKRVRLALLRVRHLRSGRPSFTSTRPFHSV